MEGANLVTTSCFEAAKSIATRITIGSSFNRNSVLQLVGN